jgi:predicted secreted hydrolase
LPVPGLIKGLLAPLAVSLALGLGGCHRGPDSAPSAVGASTPAVQADRLSVLRASDQPGFAQANVPRRFEFPQDHGPHPAFRDEWWYLTGQLHGADGAAFGFELTFFRVALRPPDLQAAPAADSAAASDWRARQVYAAHFAITDVNGRRFFNATRYARDALGLAGAQAQPFAVHADDWSLRQTSDSAALHWQLQAADGDYQLQLDLRSDQPPVLNGDAGLSRKADAAGAASYYYSMPRLQAAGHLTRRGEPIAVSGLAWLDREWGSGSLGAEQQGWDWFALDLDDGSALMFYALRDRDGRRDPHSAGTFIDAAGHAAPLANDDVGIEVLRHWTSPRGGQYPAQWQLTVRSLGLQLQVTPLLADQELSTLPRYWEGAVQAAGQRRGASVSAHGYVELVGYAQAQANPSSPSASAVPTH